MLTAKDYKQIHTLMEKDHDFEDVLNKIAEHQRMLLSSIAHDAKNTLTLLSSSLQLFQKKYPAPATDSRFLEIQQDVQHLLTLMKELSTAEFDYFLQTTQVDLVSLLQTIISDFKRGSYAETFECSLESQDTIPRIRGDNVKLTHAFANLMRNAYDAMEGCGNLRIVLNAENNYIQIAFIDTGCGINPSMADKIFDLYITSKEQGSGLGLPITKNIIESHGGMISFTSNNFGGTTFLVTLPIANFEI